MGRWKDKYIIGLTGNIAMGKSLVRRMLEHLGAFAIDADGLTHQVMSPNAPAYKPVIERFGKFILKEDGQIDRDKLGAVVFSHEDALKSLEAITHPIINSAIDTLITRARHKVVVVEAIKLLETDLAESVDAVWVVDCSVENQLKRLIEKRGLTELEAKKRISVQNPQADKKAKADVVITNDSTPDQTWKQVQAAWAKIKQGEEDAKARAAVQKVQVEPKPPAAPPKPAEAAAPPESAPAKPAAPPPAGEITSLDIKRPHPSDFDKIAQLINQATGQNITRDDIMANFGQKTYMLAEANEQAVGIIAFLVENLVTRVDEFVIAPNAPQDAVGKALIGAMENASNDLQSEVAFIFLPSDKADHKAIFVANDYNEMKVEEVRYPAWREAVNEFYAENKVLLSKRLRENLVLKPI